MPLIPPNIESLVPYQPGRTSDEIRREFGVSRIVKLASNENPVGPSPKALERVRSVLSEAHIYPDGGLKLRRAVGERFGVKMTCVAVGSGSEAIMANVMRTFLTSDEEVLTAEGTFIGFYVLARSCGVKLVTVPLRDYRYDLGAIADAISPRTKIIYLANPNNPTGTTFTRTEFERFMKRVPSGVLVILDEAYFEYAGENPDYPDSLQYRLDNVITLRTFSKAYGLAGMRIGYGFAHEDLFQYFLRVKLPFEPTLASEAAGLGALDDNEFLERTVETNRIGKARLEKAFRELGLPVVPTDANFFFVPFGSEKEALQVNDGLLRRGVIVRPLRAFRLPSGLRITVGTPEQNEILLQALKEVLPAVTG
ncbi:histidinol-phosphate transaminase [bacterium]|nr:histidinol-phosphate transaminase [bacterium]MBU1983431.1 histidinol-phosphate transaminase [bacterium]